MGKRRHQAALGATFALLVAACAASDTPLVNAPELALAPKPSVSATSEGTLFDNAPAALADASFVVPDTSQDNCQADRVAHISLLSLADGTVVWDLPSPEPGSLSVANDTTAFVSFRSNRGQAPGVGAVDIESGRPSWQRFFDSETLNLSATDDRLYVVTRNTVRALDPATGGDFWINDSQFDFDNVILRDGFAYALDNVGVKAIDLDTGRVTWTLDDVPRADTMAFTDNTITVAAQTRMVAIDTEARGRLWDINTADRLGAGNVWATPQAVFYEVSPTLAPGGGVAALSRSTGNELWSATNIGAPSFVGSKHLITSAASNEQSPGEPFVLIGLDAGSGNELWRLPSTSQVFDGVVGAGEGRVVVSDPHPVAPGFYRLRLLDTATGEVLWHTGSSRPFDGAQFELGSVPADQVALFGSSDRPEGDLGYVALLGANGQGWNAELPGGIGHSPLATAAGLLVTSPSQYSCIARLVGEPQPVIGSAVLGAKTEREQLNLRED